MSWVSWLFAVKGFFEDALHEVLQLVALLAGVDFYAAVKVGANFECADWRLGWWRCSAH
jgi:hypothetical protein